MFQIRYSIIEVRHSCEACHSRADGNLEMHLSFSKACSLTDENPVVKKQIVY